MNQPDEDKRRPRAYPVLYERGIPVVLGIIGVAVIVALLLALAIALRLIPGINY